MTLIDGDRIVTAQLYDDEHEEFTEKNMSIIDYVNAYTDEGVTTVDDVIDMIRAELIEHEGYCRLSDDEYPACKECIGNVFGIIYGILDKYKAGGN